MIVCYLIGSPVDHSGLSIVKYNGLSPCINIYHLPYQSLNSVTLSTLKSDRYALLLHQQDSLY